MHAGKTHLSYGVGQGLHNLLMSCSNDTLTIDLDNAVPHPYPTSLGNPTSHQAADLDAEKEMCSVKWKRGSLARRLRNNR